VKSDIRAVVQKPDAAGLEIPMMYYGDHISGWGWAFMAVGSVLLWAVLIFAVVVLVRHFMGVRPISFGNQPNPEEL
jgi:hypothetical protein